MTREEKIEELRKAVIDQANAMEDGWMTFDVGGKPLDVPRAPFEHWAVDLAGGAHLAKPWKTVSPVGIKQGADDPNHTDWMLGAGLSPTSMRSNGGNPDWEKLSAAAYRARADVERRLLNFRCSILLQGPELEGRAFHPTDAGDVPDIVDGKPPITVLRNAGPKWFEIAVRTFALGGAVIVENGGEMAHLVTEFRPQGCGPMVRMEGARKLYPDGTLLRVSPANGRIALPEDDKLVADRAAAAMKFDPLTDDVEEKALQAPRHTPGFGFREYTGRPSSERPSRNTTHLLPAYKLEGADYEIYASWHYTPGGRRDIHHGEEMYLHVMANSRTKTDARGGQERRLFISECRIWKDDDVRRACMDILHVVSPEAKDEWRRWERLRHEQRARDKAKLEALSDEALVGLMSMHGRDEDRLWADYEAGIISHTERLQMRADYAELFLFFEEIVGERGLAVDMAAIRPSTVTLSSGEVDDAIPVGHGQIRAGSAPSMR
jgi:hypothetical protein